MIHPESCPHLVLGLPTHASRTDLTTGFARTSRRVRTSTASPFSIDQLTAALSQLESLRDDRPFALQLAVPADPSTMLEVSIRLNEIILDVSSDLDSYLGVTPGQEESVKWALLFLNASIHRLLQWDWEKAQSYAKECLRLSRNETVRDEALNISAIALAMQGEADRAILALEKAVEGKWNLNLQSNLAVIAGDHNPELAVRQMAFIIKGAGTGEDRLAACKLAIELWRKYVDKIGIDEDELAPPTLVIEASQNLLADPALAEEAFFDLGFFLALTDGEGLIQSGVLDRSRHKTSPSAELIRARAQGIDEFVTKLIPIVKRDSENRTWLSDEVDKMVSACVAAMLNSEPSPGAAALAMQLISDGLDYSSPQRILVRCLFIGEIAPMFQDGESRPQEKFIAWIKDARNSMTKIITTDEQKTFINNLLDGAGDTLTAIFLNTFAKESSQIDNIATSLRIRMTGFFNRLSADKNAVFKAASLVRDWCRDVERICSQLTAVVHDPELKDGLATFRRIASQLSSDMSKYGR